MNKLILGLFLSGVLMLMVGCAQEYTPNLFPVAPAEIMTQPCKLAEPSADADEDLQIDVANAECVRQLRLKVYRLQDWVRNVTQ